jgi:hypothetical protein
MSVNRSPASPSLFHVDGDVGKQETAAKVVDAAIQHLVSTNLLGFLYIYITRLGVKQMLKQRWTRRTCGQLSGLLALRQSY